MGHATPHFGGDFSGTLVGQRAGGLLQVLAGSVERGDMARACAEGALTRFLMPGGGLEFLRQLFEAFATAYRKPKVGDATDLLAAGRLAIQIDLVVHDEALASAGPK